MAGEAEGPRAGREWRKAIPVGRDRMQSRALAWVLGPMLGGLCLQVLTLAAQEGGGGRMRVGPALGISGAFALVVWRLRAATGAGAVCGGMICLLVTVGSSVAGRGPARSGLVPLAALFLLTFAATHAGRTRKMKAGLAESRRGRRAAQVLANLGAAGVVCSSAGAWAIERLAGAGDLLGGGAGEFARVAVPVLLLAALVEATADTVSSEIGQAFGGRPVLLTTLRRVEAGTDGAVSLGGSLAGVLGGALVAAVGMGAMRMSGREAGIALGSGVCGVLFDSVLGATLEQKGWLGNDLVNFSSTVFAAGVALVLLLAGR